MIGSVKVIAAIVINESKSVPIANQLFAQLHYEITSTLNKQFGILLKY